VAVPAPSVPLGNQAVPGYELLGELGRGGMGIVYKARQVRAGRLVALKMILHGEHAGPAERHRFQTEAEALARLADPHIVPVFDVGEHQGVPYFSMEFCAGGSLARQLQGTPWPPDQAAALVETLARAVHAAHRAQVIHRDLKPANVLLSADGVPKITDFGLAKKLDEQGKTQTGAIMGTPSYMAPEQAGGRKEVGPAADVYALGAILYELLTGRPPFKAAAPLDTVLQVLHEEPVAVRRLQPGVPRDLETICHQCLRKPPGQRFASAAALAEDLRHFLRREPIAARPVGALERAAKWARRRPAVAGLLAAVALVSGAGVTGIAWSYREALRQLQQTREAQLEQLQTAAPAAVPSILANLEVAGNAVRPRLRELWAQEGVTADRRRRMRVGLALLAADPEAAKGPLAAWMQETDDPREMLLARQALKPFAKELKAGLWRRVQDQDTSAEQRFRALVALAEFDPGSAGWKAVSGTVVEQVLGANPLYRGLWAQALGPIRPWLERALAPRPVTEAARQADAAAVLLLMDRTEAAWPVLRLTPTPDVRSHLLARLGTAGIDAATVLKRLESEKDVSARRALILALGEFGPVDLPQAARQQWVPRLLGWYRDDPDPGIHGAIDWLLRHGKEGPVARKLDWGQARELERTDRELAGKPPGQRRWYVNGQGQTLTIVPGPIEFLMGSPAGEPNRSQDETQHRRKIGRSHAIATKAITVAEFQRFLKAHPEVKHSYSPKYSPEPDCPINMVTWYDAAQYCRWLSEREGIPEEQMCYPPVAAIQKCKDDKTPLRLPADCLRRTGYRLPTEAEWEYACRAQTATAYSFGSAVGLLDRYGWHVKNAEDRTWPVGHKRPNDWGLFDMHGNVYQWCQGAYRYYDAKGMDDEEDLKYIKDREYLQARGGAFFLRALIARCAARGGCPPAHSGIHFGCRPARTFR
jgi:formylglycine-generating enzyme required for sulfatase activity